MGYFYAFIINNFCVCIALYIIVLFEQAAKELLHPYRPILKFLSVKMVISFHLHYIILSFVSLILLDIFLAFWQSIMIAIFAHFGWIPRYGCFTTGDVATGLQNFLMCFEMCFVALLHIIAYPYPTIIILLLYMYSLMQCERYELYRVRALTNAPISSSVKTSVLKNMVNMMNQADLLKDTLESLAIQRGPKGGKDKEEKESEAAGPSHLHPFGMVPIPSYGAQSGAASAFAATHAQDLASSSSSRAQQQRGVRFRDYDEDDEDEAEGGLLAHAGREPVSSAPPALPASPPSPSPASSSLHDVELDFLSSPPAPPPDILFS